ncbi:hypothetical protein OO009_00215 [Flavobacteriaceae bacterium KMM 6897]|nr:hypothetical protein [Flavobacteriaceae bacterium KMM 6897]
MRTQLILLIAALLCTLVTQSQVTEGEWIDKENEKVLLSIEKENDKLQLNLYDRSTEIVEKGLKSYALFKDQKIPLTFNTEKDILVFNKVAYIPVAKSMKGQFTGRWKSESDDTVFQVEIDGNVELRWDIIKGDDKPIRFWPKRTETGFHFTFGDKTLSYVLKDGVLIDADGKKYSKVSEI